MTSSLVCLHLVSEGGWSGGPRAKLLRCAGGFDVSQFNTSISDGRPLLVKELASLKKKKKCHYLMVNSPAISGKQHRQCEMISFLGFGWNELTQKCR